MSIKNLLDRYELSARGQGYSEASITLVKTVTGFFDDFLGGIDDVGKVTAEDLLRFVKGLRQRTRWWGGPQARKGRLSGTTINTYVRTIKSFWAWLHGEGIIKTDSLAPVKTPGVPELLPKIMEEEELRAVFRTVAGKPREKALLMVLLDSGITLSEIAALSDASVDSKSGSIKVYREKTKRERMVYISPETAYAIEVYRSVRPEPLAEARLFLTEDGRPLTGGRIQKILERVGKAAGIGQRLSPHKLRHTFATRSLDHGSNLEYVRIMLGHRDIRTTSKSYLHVADAALAKAYRSTSPVANLGIARRNGQAAKERKPGNIVREHGAAEGGGVMSVVYSKEKKKKRKKSR